MNDMPFGEDYRTEITVALEQARATVADGLRLIMAWQTDPLTMRNAIKDISEHLDFIEIEVNRLVGSAERWERIAEMLQLQRDYLLNLFDQVYDKDDPDSIIF